MKSDISQQLPDFSLTERKCQEYVMIIIDKNISSLHLPQINKSVVAGLTGGGNTTQHNICKMLNVN